MNTKQVKSAVRVPLIACVILAAACQQAKDKNATSFLPGPIIGVQNPTVEAGGTNVGTNPSTSSQPSSSIPSPVPAPTIPPPVPVPDAIPSIVPVPPQLPETQILTSVVELRIPENAADDTIFTFTVAPSPEPLDGVLFLEIDASGLPAGLVLDSPATLAFTSATPQTVRIRVDDTTLLNALDQGFIEINIDPLTSAVNYQAPPFAPAAVLVTIIPVP